MTDTIKTPEWINSLPIAVTASDAEARIIYMNHRSAETFEKDCGQKLIGKSLFECHSERSAMIIRELLESGRNNIYTIEKNGKRKMICQLPWFEDGEVAGLVEISIPLPDEIPHFIRS